jgi:hypothetical protein
MAKTLLQCWLDLTLGKPDEQVANDSLGVRAAFAGSTRAEIGHGAFENVPDLRAVKNVTLDEGIQKAGKDRAAGNGRPDGLTLMSMGVMGNNPPVYPIKSKTCLVDLPRPLPTFFEILSLRVP